MASTINLVFLPEDEATFFAFLASQNLRVYPEFFERTYHPFVASAESIRELEDQAFYLAAEDLAPMVFREVKRGKRKGLLEVEERESPVIHYQRSELKGQSLVAGRLWTELSQESGQHQSTHPESFRRLWMSIREFLMKQCTRSRPPGWLVGKEAARRYRGGLKLLSADHRPKTLEPFR